MERAQRFSLDISKHHGFRTHRVGIVVHPTVERLRKAHGPDPNYDRINGFCRPTPYRERYNKRTKAWERVPEGPTGAVVHMARGLVTTEIVTHELTHAALALYRINVKATVHLGNGVNSREELLAYMVGELCREAANKITERGLWTT